MESMEKIRLNNGVQMPPIGYGVYRMTDPAAASPGRRFFSPPSCGSRTSPTRGPGGGWRPLSGGWGRILWISTSSTSPITISSARGVPREELYEEGKVRAIGVDNFTQDRLDDFLFWNKVPPAVDLLECNPFCQREGDLSYLRSKNILLQAWSPLAAGQDDLLHNETLARIGAGTKNPRPRWCCGGSPSGGSFPW